MLEVFYITKESQIFLYGDNYLARNFLESLTARGYTVRAILDRKYTTPFFEDGVSFMNLDCLHAVPDNAVVVIMLSNGLNHERVKTDIVKKGINNILYLPMLSHRPLQEEDLIRRAYVSFSSFTLSERTAIPITVEDKPNDGILRVFCNEYETAFLCPVFCLRTGNEEQTLQVRLPGRDGLLARRAIPYELPLKDFSPYIELFDYLFGKGKYPSEYLHFQRNTQEEMDALLEDRKILFKVYEQNYEYNFSFFLYSPARAQWNDNGYFNVLDGLHRCTYLMRKGKTSVPVAVNNGDFEKYKHFIHKNDK